MSRSRPLAAVAALTLATLAMAVLALAGAGGAATAGRPPARFALPAHVFAPYFEAYTRDSPARLSRESGARYLILAFIQTPKRGSCTIDWNGNPATPVSPRIYGSDIARIRAAGGSVVPSFGGFSADHTGTEIADSCKNVALIAAAYEKVIKTYHVTRLDLDTEDNSLTNTAGIGRRNKAIRMVEAWAGAHHRTVQFVYTLPANVTGPGPAGLHVLRDAVSNHARVGIVNIMTFDYYDNKPHEMAKDSMTAAGHLYSSLHSLYPAKSPRQLWSMIGITEMIGIDDFGPPEVFTIADAKTIEHWAVARHLAELSFWALQRDNGGCPGKKGRDGCSGLHQPAWQFTHIFEPFSRR